MQPNMQDSLSRLFGFSALRTGQQQVIDALMAGRSAAAIFPTGAGKSLCYQLPALHLPHLTLVISPLLALMQDQLSFLHSKGISAASIDSAQSREDTSEVMRRARNGQLKILMVSVERLKNERFRDFLSQVRLSLLVVDEAHCISEWGHNFRPDYLKLPSYQRQFNIPQVLLLTATATPKVIEDMGAKFTIAPQDVIRTGFYRANLHLQVEPVSGEQRLPYLCHWLGQRPNAACIVYVTQQKTAEQLALQLSQAGLSAGAYHAGLDYAEREALQQQFMHGAVRIMVATIAFGMGIDKRDIRAVVHYDLPKSIENYSQEIGRAGRDGQRAECLVLANRDSQNLLQNFVYGDTPELSGIDHVLQALKDSAAQGDWAFMLGRLSDQADIRQLPLKTLLVQLELRGIIAPLYSYFAEYRFKYLQEESQILQRFDANRQQFLRQVFAAAPRARLWCSLNTEQLYQQQGVERSRVIKALQYLHEQGLIELQSTQMTEVYRLQQPDFDLTHVAQQLHQAFAQHQDSEIARIQAMLELFASERCISARLAEYFGDSLAPAACGHCSVCHGQIARLPTPPALTPLSQLDLESLSRSWQQQHLEATGHSSSSETLTRFLCGILTPLMTRLKARRLSHFGCLEQYPYSQVRAWIQSNGTPSQ